MQSGYGASEIHQHHQQQQHFIDDVDADGCCPSVFNISNPQNDNYLYHHPQQQQQQPQQQPQQQMFQPPPPPSHFSHQLITPFHIFHQPQQQLLFEVQGTTPTSHPIFDVNFRLGLNENSGNKDEQQGQQHQQSLLMPPHPWHSSQEDSSANKLQHHSFGNKNYKKLYSTHEISNKCKYFGGELEPICSLANGKIDVETNNQIPVPDSAVIGVDLDHSSESSTGQDVSLEKIQGKRKRKRKMKEKFGWMVEFIEGLVKQMMDHQEGLHQKFLEVVQKMEREKFDRDEAWRRKVAATYKRESINRANEQSISSIREDMIISFLEKITGQSINLPQITTALSSQSEVTKQPTKGLKSDMNNCRWPKAEVEALIQVRGSLESRFVEPGLKGPLWEEVSALMASMGYQRSAKRCKEKWENINKYFRKIKERGKKPSPQSKTCPYFEHLDTLYSRNIISLPSTPDTGLPNQGYSELLEALVAGKDLGNANETLELGQGSHGDEKENQQDEDKFDADGEGN